MKLEIELTEEEEKFIKSHSCMFTHNVPLFITNRDKIAHIVKSLCNKGMLYNAQEDGLEWHEEIYRATNLWNYVNNQMK